MEMAKHVDLIFVFLDPHGMALCTRTMQVVEMLNKSPHHLYQKVRRRTALAHPALDCHTPSSARFAAHTQSRERRALATLRTSILWPLGALLTVCVRRWSGRVGSAATI